MTTSTRPQLKRSTIAHQVRDDLREQIKSGELPAGAKMPSESDCCKMYGVSRATVREAFRLLEQEGLLEARHGSGRFVLPGATVMVQGSVNLVESTIAILSTLGYDPEIRVIGERLRPSTEEEARVFGLSAGDEVFEVERAYVHGRELLTHATNIVDVARLPVPLAQMDWSQSIASAFAAVGRTISAGFTDIRALQLPESIAAQFDVPEDAAWLGFDGPLFDQRGEPLWWSHEMWRGDVRPLRVVNRRDRDS